jgi:hypothetical protein
MSRPSHEQLLRQIGYEGMRAVARRYGVSRDEVIRWKAQARAAQGEITRVSDQEWLDQVRKSERLRENHVPSASSLC